MLRNSKIIIVRTTIIMYSIFIFSCSNYDMIAEKERETTAVYEPKTNVGKTLSAFDKAQKKAVSEIISTAQEYYDEAVKSDPGPEPSFKGDSRSTVTRSMKTDFSQMSFEDIEKVLPNKSGNVYTRRLSSTTRSGDEIIMEDEEIVVVTEDQLAKIREMEDKINKIVEEYNNAIELLKPDISTACAYDFVEPSKDGENIVIGGDMIYDTSTIEGALIVEMLTAKSTGITIDEIEDDLKNLGLALPEEEINRGHYQKYTTKWYNGEIKYKFRNISDAHKNEMINAMNDWSNRTGFLKFINAVDSYWEGVWQDTNMSCVLNIFDDNIEASGSSNVGYTGSNELRLNENGLLGDQLHRTTRHELGHTIGLKHEHQRWDRDNYVDLNGWDNSDTTNIEKLARYHEWWGAV